MDESLVVAAALIAAVMLIALAYRLRRRTQKAARTANADAQVGIVVGGDECEVVGESQYQRELEQIVGGRAARGARHKCFAVLQPEPANPHDPNAVRVEVNGLCVGYLPRTINRQFNEELTLLGYKLAVCEATIVGGWKATKKQSAGHFGIVLDACVPFEFDEIEPPRA